MKLDITDADVDIFAKAVKKWGWNEQMSRLSERVSK